MIKHYIKLFFLFCLSALFINPATAAFDPTSELKFTASDGATDDQLGWSVSIDGTRMAVSAYGDDSDRGAVYIYDFNGTNWSQTTKLVAVDGAAGDRFGRSVALSGNRLAVGAYRDDIGSNNDQGSAYIFDLSGGTWSQTTRLTASDGAAGDSFGGSLSLSNNRLAVGAWGDDIGSNSDQGAAYIFDLSGGTWGQTTKLTATDGAADDFFGFPVSLSGDRLAVGAMSADIGANDDQGAVYVYSDTAATYTIGGTISGLSGTVVLQNNGGDNLSVSTNGTFTFTTPIASGGAYSVSVATQPTGQTCTVSNASGTATANVTNVSVSCSNTTSTTSLPFTGIGGTGTLSISGGGSSCNLDSVNFHSDTTTLSGSPQAPSGWTFPQGLVGFTASNCTIGATINVSIDFPTALTGSSAMKWGSTASQTADHWYNYPVSVSGNTVTYSVTDGGNGDDDLTANGTIVDPIGIGGGILPVPSLSDKALALLMLVLAGLTASFIRQRRLA